jgi:hypothetical protein
MPRSLVDLSHVGGGWEVVLNVQLYGRWFCLAFCGISEGKKNDRSIKDRERTVVKLKSFFFKTLFHWTTALDLNLLNFHEFLYLFSIASYVFFLYTLCVLRLRYLRF